MKKIYALLLGLLAFAWLALVPAAQPQYTIFQAIPVRCNHNPWVSNVGTEISSITATSIYNYQGAFLKRSLPSITVSLT